jgi:glycopeptide antibiotics resistance protein
LLNILLYVPLGFLLSDLRYLGSLKIILLGFACSTLTELTQLVFHLGLFEFDDIFDNTLGCILGVLFFLFLRFLTQKMQDGKSRPAKGHEY